MNIFKKNNKKICVIAEKADVARRYAEVLGCVKNNGYFENDKYIIVWTNGHVATLYDPEDYDIKYKNWNMDHLPIMPNGFWIKVRKNKINIVELIKKQVYREDVKSVCIATDSAREGCLIGEYLLMVIENKKPVYRVMISAPNEIEILRGFKNMEPEEKYRNLTAAAQARDEVDWLIGCNFSRGYSVLEKKKYYIGRCKTVILNLLCKREDEIKNTEQRVYYGITSNFTNDDNNYSGKLLGEIYTFEEAENVKCLSGKMGVITSIESETRIIAPDPLFNLNDLLRMANRRYGYISEDTYKIAQSLYEKYKLISYSRTDSNYIRESMIDEIKLTLKCIKNGKFELEKSGINNIKTFIRRCVDDNKVIEHSAIVPLPMDKEQFLNTLKELPEKEKNIYMLIIENFLANFKDDYVYENKRILTDMDSFNFITNIHIPIEPGWKLNKDYKSTNLELNIKEGNIVKCEDIRVEKKLSKLPSRYNDDTLLAILENPGKFVKDKKMKDLLKEHGIGTDATRALLIQDLVNKGYIVREQRDIIPTVQGQELIAAIKNEKLKQPFFTAEIEEQLQLIQSGQLSKDKLIKNVMHFISEEISVVKNSYDSKPKYEAIGGCPRCGVGRIMENKDGKGYGCTNLKNKNNPCRFYLAKKILGVDIDKIQAKKLIIDRETDIFTFIGSKGPFKAKIILDKNNNTQFKS